MKKRSKKLHLTRETLRSLDSLQLKAVAGGNSYIDTTCEGLCVSCHPENCLHTEFCGGGESAFCPPPTNLDC